MGKRVGDGVDAPAPEFQFEFHCRDYDVPADVQGYTKEKLGVRLHKFGHRVISVTVWMKDLNGTKGGVDKVCHMEARLAGMEPVNVQEINGDLRAVIDLAMDRLEDALRRHIGKMRTKPRQEGRKLVRNRKTTTTV
jgi:ribosome-associated translation inhibitor RaiA